MSSCKECDCVPVRGERGLRGLSGAQGDTGGVGPQGPQGPQGPAGAGAVPGALNFSFFSQGALDFGWPSVVTSVPGTSFVPLVDGNYQVHANLLTRYFITNPNLPPYAGLYINGALIIQKFVVGADTNGTFTREVSFLWRGSLLANDLVDIRVISGAIGVVATSIYSELLVNKEG